MVGLGAQGLGYATLGHRQCRYSMYATIGLPLFVHLVQFPKYSKTLVKNQIFLRHVYLGPVLGVTLLEFYQHPWCNCHPPIA